MFPPDLSRAAAVLIDDLRAKSLKLVTAESCTGGLIAGLITDIPGSSDVLERGYVTYSNDAKIDCLGVSAATIMAHGAVSSETARAMASGALQHSKADVAIAVTGIAGPGGGTPEKPVGLVHIAAATRQGGLAHKECRFGDIGRSKVRVETLRQAIALVGGVV